MSSAHAAAQYRRRFAAWAAALALLHRFSARAQTVEPPRAGASFDRAMDDYVAQRFDAAFDGFAQLADSGHCEAARIALLMRAHGARLYGRSFRVDAARRQRWVDAAAPAAATASLSQ
ncbi:MAG: hypothetical protein OEV65_03920 [Aquincola sp.]|nr:hypothetical protein [Aquincola sp.]